MGTLSQRITNQLMGLKGLNQKLKDMHSYLEQVSQGKLPMNHQITYHLQVLAIVNSPRPRLGGFLQVFYLGYFQPSPRHNQPQFREVPPGQHQRPDVGHVPRVLHQVGSFGGFFHRFLHLVLVPGR